jgi:beta-phosphoglucomutase-like phosphatase (HAD superfamily)
MAITDVILDFDGTCTQIPLIYQQYLDQYLVEFSSRLKLATPVTTQEWNDMQQTVREHSPKAAWTVKTTAAAPAAADPYILAYETSKALLRKRPEGETISEPPFEAHVNSNNAHAAPWRPEAKEIFETLLNKGIKVHFVSNTSSATILKRLSELFTELPKGLSVQSGAAKFSISELSFDSKISNELKKKFEHVPVAHSAQHIGRPVYLRRSYYFEALCAALDNDLHKLHSTVVCGDIWEMDLAMPHELGANIHLVERASPFDTYPFERDAVTAAKSRGKVSHDLRGLLDWL